MSIYDDPSTASSREADELDKEIRELANSVATVYGHETVAMLRRNCPDPEQLKHLLMKGLNYHKKHNHPFPYPAMAGAQPVAEPVKPTTASSRETDDLDKEIEDLAYIVAVTHGRELVEKLRRDHETDRQRLHLHLRELWEAHEVEAAKRRQAVIEAFAQRARSTRSTRSTQSTQPAQPTAAPVKPAAAVAEAVAAPPAPALAAATPDYLTALTVAGGKRARKLFGPEGERASFDAGKWFSVREVEARDLSSLLVALQSLGQNEFVIRGRLRPGLDPHRVRRTRYAQDDGSEPFFVAQPRRWLCIDTDGFPLHGGVDPWSPNEVGKMVRGALPVEFRTARCLVHMSANAGIKPDARLHLWFWLDRPVSDAEIKKRWLKGTPFLDLALYNPVQPHYTADPEFVDGARDPWSRRWAILPGTAEVAVPDFPPEPEPVKAPRAPREPRQPRERVQREPRERSDAPHWFTQLSRPQQLRELERMLRFLTAPEFGDYDLLWLPVSMAVYDAIKEHPDEGVFAIWDRWCQRLPGYDPEGNAAKWHGGHFDAAEITIGTLIFHAREAGYEPPPGAFDITRQQRRALAARFGKRSGFNPRHRLPGRFFNRRM
jgi:hypothetical protein